MDYYECPQCKNKVKNIHRESHELYCINSIRQSEFENLIPCEICNNLIAFDEFMNHMENCRMPVIPPPPVEFINLLNNFPPLGNNPQPMENEDEYQEELDDQDVDQEDIENQPLNNTAPENINPAVFALPLPPDLNNENLRNQINELFANIVNIETTLGTNNILDTFNTATGDDYQNLTNLINQVGNVNVGIDDINKVTTIEVNTIDCPICGDNFDIVRRTACRHDFCFNCLNEWIRENNTCPICSIELKEL